MLFWKNHDKREKIQDAIGVEIKDPTTVGEAIDKYLETHKDERIWKYPVLALRKYIRKNRRLDSLTIGDFLDADKNHKAAIQRIIRFAATGENIPSHPSSGTSLVHHNGNDSGDGNHTSDIGKLTFGKAKTADILKLIPLSGMRGRFAAIKLEVHNQIHSLPKDESGIIQAPKRSMDQKEATTVTTTVNKMLGQHKLQWKLVWNPLKAIFILIRKEDLEKVEGGK